MLNLAAAASTTASSLTGGLIHASTLQANLDRNTTLYNLATTGDQASLDDLVVRSGITGLSSGYAPQRDAREDARAKIQALLNAGIISGPNPVPPQALAPTGVKYTVVVKSTTTAGHPAQTSSTLSNAFTGASTNMPLPVLLVVGGLLAWGVYHLIKKGA